MQREELRITPRILIRLVECTVVLFTRKHREENLRVRIGKEKTHLKIPMGRVSLECRVGGGWGSWKGPDFVGCVKEFGLLRATESH